MVTLYIIVHLECYHPYSQRKMQLQLGQAAGTTRRLLAASNIEPFDTLSLGSSSHIWGGLQ